METVETVLDASPSYTGLKPGENERELLSQSLLTLRDAATRVAHITFLRVRNRSALHVVNATT